MSADLPAVLLGGLLAGLGGLCVPALIAWVPEPAPRETEPETASEDASEAGSEDASEDGSDAESAPEDDVPKRLYVDIAAATGLRMRSALVAAVSGALVGWSTGLDWPLVWLVPLVPVGVALSTIDWHTRLLPRVIVVPATLATLLLVTVVGLATDQRGPLVSALLVMIVARSFFWVLWAVLGGAGMGFGDVRLAALIGLVLGWLGPGPAVVGFWIGMVVFGVPGLVLAIVKWERSLMKKAFPFGPFMIIGALAGLVWGTAVSRSLWG